MSDRNMCGASGDPLKSFSEQTDRDRSLHQDRATVNRNASSSFRSGPAQNTAEGDQALANFQNGMPNMIHQVDGPAMGHFNIENGQAQQAQAQAPARAPIPIVAASGKAARHQPNRVSTNWVDQFVASVVTPVPEIDHAAAARARRHAAIAANSFVYNTNRAGVGARAMVNTVQAEKPAHVPAEESPAMAAAFAAAFARIEEQAKAVTYNREDEFNQSMNEWMQEHGPTKAQQYAELDRIADEQMEIIANELDRAAISKNDLRRTAEDIVDSIGENNMFKHSQFLALMREITAGHVTVDSEMENFVYAHSKELYVAPADAEAKNTKAKKN